MLRTRYRFQNEVKGISEMAYRIVSYVVLCKLKISKSDGGHAISHQEKRGLPKSTARFPAKKRWHSPSTVGLSCDYPPPTLESVRACGCTLKS